MMPHRVPHGDGAAAGRTPCGKTFVFTGTLSRIGRNEAKALVESMGAVGSSVTKTTNYVVAGEAVGSKIEKGAAVGHRHPR